MFAVSFHEIYNKYIEHSGLSKFSATKHLFFHSQCMHFTQWWTRKKSAPVEAILIFLKNDDCFVVRKMFSALSIFVNGPIRADNLFKSLYFVDWKMFWTWLITPEKHYPLPSIHYLVTVNIHQASIKVNKCIFPTWRNSIIRLYFHVSYHFARLPLNW